MSKKYFVICMVRDCGSRGQYGEDINEAMKIAEATGWEKRPGPEVSEPQWICPSCLHAEVQERNGVRKAFYLKAMEGLEGGLYSDELVIYRAEAIASAADIAEQMFEKFEKACKGQGGEEK